MHCPDCEKPIKPGDDAGVCIECGGRNERDEVPFGYWDRLVAWMRTWGTVEDDEPNLPGI